MRATIVALAVTLLIAGLAPIATAHDPGSHGELDDPSDLYQNDGNSSQDASDDCRTSKLLVQPNQPLPEREGNIVPGDDLADTWQLDAPEGSALLGIDTAPAAPELLEGLAEDIRFQVTLKVFGFVDPSGEPPFLACQDPIHEENVTSGEEAVVGFDVEPGVTYFAQVEVSGIGPVVLDEPSPVAPMNGHCRPTCAQGYSLSIS